MFDYIVDPFIRNAFYAVYAAVNALNQWKFVREATFIPNVHVMNCPEFILILKKVHERSDLCPDELRGYLQYMKVLDSIGPELTKRELMQFQCKNFEGNCLYVKQEK